MKTLTRTGFKRVINKQIPLNKGYKRKFVECAKCKEKAFYDYIPYSLSNMIKASNCGHYFAVYYKEF